MDSDDISYRTRIEEQYNFLAKNKDIDMCSVQAKLFGDVSSQQRLTNFSQNVEFIPFIKKHQIVHPAMMFKRSLNIRYLPFMPQEDCYLFRDLLCRGVKISNLNKTLYSYRINSNSIMKRFAKYCKFEVLKFNIYFLGKYLNENLSFQEDIFTKKSFDYEDLIDFLKYSRVLSQKLKNEIDVYKMFYPYFKYMISHTNGFSYKHIGVLFNPLMYGYEQQIIKEIQSAILKFCFQLNNKYENNKKTKMLTILGVKIPLYQVIIKKQPEI